MRFCHNFVKMRQRKDRNKISRADITTMALERLQACTAAGIPDPNGVVVGRRRQPRRVVREGHRVNKIAMALKRLQARAAASIPDTNGSVPGRRRQPVLRHPIRELPHSSVNMQKRVYTAQISLSSAKPCKYFAMANRCKGAMG
jgi:hypothetical protein